MVLLYHLSPRYPFPGVRQHALANSFPNFCSFYCMCPEMVEKLLGGLGVSTLALASSTAGTVV